MRRFLVIAFLAVPALCQVSPQRFAAMRWREIGPLRAGRTHALAGVPSQPNVFYIGAVNGGVWKTDDGGETWQSIFDDEPSGSIGAVAVAQSNPNIVYVGSGEGLQRPDLSTGDGMYKSTDAGRTWERLGLRDGQQIAKIIVDPRDPNRLFVAVVGHPFGPNPERGVFRSTDGGQHFDKVLYKDDNTGADEVVFDPSNPQIVYAGLWNSRQGPWENAAWTGDTGGVFKSTDGGDHWTAVGGGLPAGAVKVDSIAIAPSDPRRLYVPITTNGAAGGMWRSDDAGATWQKASTDPRMLGGEQIVAVDPKNPDVLYDATRVTWKSTDGGRTWDGWRGAPGGDDYQNIWVNPNDGDIVALASDQGGIVTVNGGRTWSSWYTQATAQVYHVTADNAYPYRLCGGQQDSGSACVSSRSDDGEITFHDWHPAGVVEYGYAAPDPLDPDIVYGGSVTRYDRRTGQISNVGPTSGRGGAGDYRTLRTTPLQFSPLDPHLLYFASNTLWATRDGGQHWRQLSPDLTRKTWAIPASVGIFADQASAQPSQRGVIYAIAPSPVDANRIWAGTDDGLIQTTADGGKTWQDVTPPQLQPWWKVSILDAGHFDGLTAYAAVNTLRLDDLRPHLFRTHDGGKSWTEIDNGLAADAPTDAIREDPKQKGLLFAGTETEVWVSFDDGDHWQSLRQNMPAVSVRDLQIKDDDLVAGTHGRGFEILDDITPLRQIAAHPAAAGVMLYAPETATRVRWDMNPPTPWPPDMPAGENPPPGAMLDYYLPQAANGVVTLEVLDAAGKVVRRYASNDPVPPENPFPTWPRYWDRPTETLAATTGMHRFIWDLHYTPVPGISTELDDGQAVVHNTPRQATSPWVMPGAYSVRLTVGGQTYTQTMAVRMDPRVKTPAADLAAQGDLALRLYTSEMQMSQALDTIAGMGPRVAGTALQGQLAALGGTAAAGRGGGGRGRGGAAGPDSFNSLRSAANTLLHSIESADSAPTAVDTAAAERLLASAAALQTRWEQLRTQIGPGR